MMGQIYEKIRLKLLLELVKWINRMFHHIKKFISILYNLKIETLSIIYACIFAVYITMKYYEDIQDRN